jgi:hypothetical protein
MAMEVKIIPSKLIVAFDSINALSEQDHENGYVQAFHSVLNCLACFVERNVNVEIPDCIVNSEDRDGILRVKPNMSFSDVLNLDSTLARRFYLLDEYEVILVLHIDNLQYQLKCYSDPVVFTFESM